MRLTDAQRVAYRSASHIARVLGIGGKAAPRQRDTRDTHELLTTSPMERTRQSRRMGDYTSYLNAITIPNVYKAVNVIVSTYAATPLRVLDADQKDVDVQSRLPDLYQLLRKPNPQTRGRAWRQSEVIDYVLTGNSITAYDSWDAYHRPHEMFRLRPDKVLIAQTNVGSLAYGYEIMVGPKKDVIWYDETEIRHVKWFNPRDPLWGLGAIEAGELSLSKDKLINEFSYNFFDRGAIVDGVLSTPNQMPETDRRAMIADWKAMRAGARNQIRTALLWMGATYTPIGTPLGDVPIAELARMGRNDVFELLGVPPQMVGDFSDTNYRNAQEANAFFLSETMGPILDQFDEDGYAPLAEMYGPFEAQHEKREVIDLAMRAEAAGKLGAVPGFNLNQLYVTAGFDPLPDDDPMGQMLVMPKGSSLQHPEDVIDPPDDALTDGLGQIDAAGLLLPDDATRANPEGRDAPPASGAEAAATGKPPASGPAAGAGTGSKAVTSGRSTRTRPTPAEPYRYPRALLSDGARDRQRVARTAGQRDLGPILGAHGALVTLPPVPRVTEQAPPADDDKKQEEDATDDAHADDDDA